MVYGMSLKMYNTEMVQRLFVGCGCAVGYNPRWDDELTLTVHVPELAIINFTVYTKDAFVAQYSLPFTSILQGLSCLCEPLAIVVSTEK